MGNSTKSFTGRKRKRKTQPSVHMANAVAKWVITLGGIGTIASVIMVAVFLVYVVIPLFVPPSLPQEGSLPTARETQEELAYFGVDEYMSMTYSIYSDGVLVLSDLADGTVISQRQLFEGLAPTCWSSASKNGDIAFGFEDGSVVLGRIYFEPTYSERSDMPSGIDALKTGEKTVYQGGVVEVTPEEQFRLQSLYVDLNEPLQVSPESPIHKIDYSEGTSGKVFVAISADGMLRLEQVNQRRNLITGEVKVTLQGGETQLDFFPATGLPDWLMLTGLGDSALLVWKDGTLMRYDTRSLDDIRLAEADVDLTEEPGVDVAALGFLIGKTTLVVGDSEGNTVAWFRVNTDYAYATDDTRLMPAHEMAVAGVAVTSIGASERSRKVAVGYADGSVRLFHVTSDQQLAMSQVPDATDAVIGIAISPKEDHLLAVAGSIKSLWKIDAPHPETTFASIFLPIWYEGYQAPEHVWQTSSATDDFEPKYGMLPLIFGTLKATLYSMLFGAPLALLAAIYTSEFLNPKRKAIIKPTIEMMASLPSVVLGFLAGLVIAPFIEDYVPQALTAILTIPFALLLGAYLWQLIPTKIAVPMRRYRLAFMVLALPAGFFMALLLGPAVEDLMLAGDIKTWLDGQAGSGLAGWMFMFLPLSGLVVALVVSRVVNPRIRAVSGDWSTGKFAAFDLAKFLAAAALVLFIAFMFSWILTAVGLDPRGSYIDTYVQRNAMVVGFIMGFAIIPIIYTIAEDALSAVPEHLRAGSLGAGATPWQTATRIIIPTAMSGLFSALMIGLGRAVGETMIVLMAAGNTPVMDWNIFNGFRTLSANIAVELPEAVQNSTHYRTLFLAALVLFVMTFLVNTVAEVIRQRFRKRSAQL